MRRGSLVRGEVEVAPVCKEAAQAPQKRRFGMFDASVVASRQRLVLAMAGRAGRRPATGCGLELAVLDGSWLGASRDEAGRRAGRRQERAV